MTKGRCGALAMLKIFIALTVNPLAAQSFARPSGERRQNRKTKQQELQTARWPAEHLPDEGHRAL